MEEKNILTDTEARSILGLEDNYPSSTLTLFNQMTTSYIDARTGHQWEADAEIDVEAKSCASLLLQKTFFNDQSHDFTQGIADYVFELRLKAEALS